jgi:anti-anti-sigma factor
MNAVHHTTELVAIARGLGKVIVTVHGRLDRGIVPTVDETLVGLARSGDVDAIIIDLRDVSFLDARGLGLLVDWSEVFWAQGREFVLNGPTPPVRHALDKNPAAKNLHITPP